MGAVYQAQSADGKRVAIKILKAAGVQDAELVARFQAEARALKELHHPGVVEILSVGRLEDGTHYYVMEYLEGRSFEQLISKGAPFKVADVLSWMQEILDALEVVHQAGVIHRDLKPANLFLSRTGIGAKVKLIDFGVAKQTGAGRRNAPKSLDTAFVGTPEYMSPEQVRGRQVTAATDLYALGCVMFEMLTAVPPFVDRSPAKKMLMHVEQPAPHASSVISSIPKAVDDIIEWMMRKEPTERPPSAQALKARIDSVKASLAGSSQEHISIFDAVTDPNIQLETAPAEPFKPKFPAWWALLVAAMGVLAAGYWYSK